LQKTEPNTPQEVLVHDCPIGPGDTSKTEKAAQRNMGLSKTTSDSICHFSACDLEPKHRNLEDIQISIGIEILDFKNSFLDNFPNMGSTSEFIGLC
jgi:hypothetical protein